MSAIYDIKKILFYILNPEKWKNKYYRNYQSKRQSHICYYIYYIY